MADTLAPVSRIKACGAFSLTETSIKKCPASEVRYGTLKPFSMDWRVEMDETGVVAQADTMSEAILSVIRRSMPRV